MTAPATYCGTQEGFDDIPDIELFNLTADIEGHNVGSTVSRQTLEAAGFRVTSPRDREIRRRAWYFRNHAA